MTEEDRIQSAICSYLDVALKPPARYFAIPNGQKRHIAVARLLKRTGVKPGVPDLIIIAPGILIGAEVKTDKGRLSKEQKAFAEDLTACGAVCTVLRSVSDAEAVVRAYGLGRSA